MLRPRLAPGPALLALATLLPLFATGCATAPRAVPHSSRAFIQYWGQPEKGSQSLRLAVKDNIDMKGVVTSAGSEYLAKHAPPATADAPCLALARARGVHIVGKTNLSEFAVSPSGINEYFGTPKNPFDYWFWRKLLPGGSSSGSAAAVATGMADVAFGTDTAGSVRVPAALCGVVGLKTTHGLVPLKGIYPIEAKHLDTVGPIASDIEHTVKGMALLEAGFEGKYAAAKAARPDGRAIRVGRFHPGGTNRLVDLAIDQALARAGFQVVELDPAFKKKWEQAKADGNTLAAGGAWMSDAKFGSKPGIAARTKAAILVGRLAWSTGAYDKALARREAWRQTLRQTFTKVDFIALPTVNAASIPMPPDFRLGIVEAFMLGEQNTVAVNFAGNPAIALPVHLRHAPVPVTSLQLIGPDKSEAQLLNAGRIIEADQNAS